MFIDVCSEFTWAPTLQAVLCATPVSWLSSRAQDYLLPQFSRKVVSLQMAVNPLELEWFATLWTHQAEWPG